MSEQIFWKYILDVKTIMSIFAANSGSAGVLARNGSGRDARAPRQQDELSD